MTIVTEDLKQMVAKWCSMLGVGAFALLLSMVVLYGLVAFDYNMSLLISAFPVYMAIRLVREKIEHNHEVNKLLKMPAKKVKA